MSTFEQLHFLCDISGPVVKSTHGFKKDISSPTCITFYLMTDLPENPMARGAKVFHRHLDSLTREFLVQAMSHGHVRHINHHLLKNIAIRTYHCFGTDNIFETSHSGGGGGGDVHTISNATNDHVRK